MEKYEDEKLAGRTQMNARAKIPGVVQIKQREFDVKTGKDLGLKVVEELNRAEINSRIVDAEAELAWLVALSADFDATAEKP